MSIWISFSRSVASPALKIRNEFEFQDVVDELGLPADLLIRDFALVTVAAKLVEVLGDGLCFKGGFVLRHVHGHDRFSKDIDATKFKPPKNKLDADSIRDTINSASVTSLLTVRAAAPTTDSKQSLDFDRVAFDGPLGEGSIAVEVSYREAVVLDPQWVEIGRPYYEPFEIPVMQLEEIVAEKLRTLAQRTRPTDLSDLGSILLSDKVDRGAAKPIVGQKFALVKDGDKRERIERNIAAMEAEYESTVRAVAPDAIEYDAARKAVVSALPELLP
jgi:uncharacterized protein